MERDAGWVESMYESALPQCRAERVRHRADTIFLLVMGGRIIAMQTGFAMLEAAYARPMNAANIMMKNFMDLFLGAVVFYFFGYWIAFNQPPQILEEIGFDFALWFLHFSYATTAATINSGALAGRVSFGAYLVLSALLTGIIYPIAVNWAWSDNGWLQKLGYVDFAGSSVVHLIGAMSALVAVCICGPRVGKYPHYRGWKGFTRILFAERNPDTFYHTPESELEKAVFTPIKPCNNPVQLLFGTFLLLCGFLAFNPASTFATTLNTDLVSARATVTTLIAAAGGSMAALVWALVTRKKLVMKVPDLTNAVLGGLVSSCACCHVVPPVIMLIVGYGGGQLALSTAAVMDRRQLDDTVGAVAAHGPPAVWGVLCVALFAAPHCQSELRGLFFGGGEEAWAQLGIQATGLIALAAFAAISTYFGVLAIDLIGGFRCNRACELIGLDFTEHEIDDGQLRLDEKHMHLMVHSPVRDCLVERVKRIGTISPLKSYMVDGDGEEQPKDEDVPLDSGVASSGFADLANEVDAGETTTPSGNTTSVLEQDEIPAACTPRSHGSRMGSATSGDRNLEKEVLELKKHIRKLNANMNAVMYGLDESTRTTIAANWNTAVGSNCDARYQGTNRRAALEQLMHAQEVEHPS